VRIWLIGGLLAAAAVAAAGYFFLHEATVPAPKYRTATVERGALVSAVSASGTLNPVTSVVVGSQLSGQIAELLADYNSEVKAGQIIARLDTDQLVARRRQAVADLEVAQAAVAVQRAQIERARADQASARAAIVNARAQVERAASQLKEAERELRRKRELLGRGATSATEAERAEAAFDQARAQLNGAEAQANAALAVERAADAALRIAEAQLDNAQAQVKQREAAVALVDVDLARAEIRSPIDGVVVQRNVEIGQTVAASLQAPVLFNIAQDLRRMQVHASIDEADVGRVRTGQFVSFTVDAFPGQNFEGRVEQIRLGPQVTQNVVTYVVLVSVDNSALRLLPGMTANVRIVIDRRDDVLKVANAALRFRPPGVAAAGGTGGANGAVPAGGPPAGNAGGAPGAQLDVLAARLTEELELDEGQRQQLAEIIDNARRAGAALARSGLAPEERRQQGAALRRQTGERIEAMLRPDQRPRYAEMRGAARAGERQGQVWVLDRDGTPRPRAVRLGISDGSVTEIVAGELSAGEAVLVGGGDRPTSQAGGPPRLGF
jgi:HlyD family secretion protein